MRPIRMIRAGEDGSVIDEFLKGYIAIGWKKLPNLTKVKTHKRVSATYDKTIKETAPTKRGNAISNIYNFLNDIKSDDTIITYNPKTKTYYIGSSIGKCTYSKSLIDGYPHTRTIIWTKQVARHALNKQSRDSLTCGLTLFTIEDTTWKDIKSKASIIKNEDKISRITWNTNGWKFPSGSKGKSTAVSSFEYKFKFGFEEWLLNNTREIDGYHYAFLETLSLKSDKHVNCAYNIHLYSILNPSVKYYVGHIKNVECISKEDSTEIYKTYKKNGWIADMISDINYAGGDSKELKSLPPNKMFNLRFKFKDVSIARELIEISKKDKNITATRMKLLPKSENFKFKSYTDNEDIDEGNLKNTDLRTRVFGGESTFSPLHDIMQNTLKKILDDQYKKEYKLVQIEKSRVDIIGTTHSNDKHYFEVKTDNAKLSIRKAIGQLLEYAYWPNKNRANRLIIIAGECPDKDDQAYLKHIRGKFKIPIYFRCLDLNNNKLSDDF